MLLLLRKSAILLPGGWLRCSLFEWLYACTPHRPPQAGTSLSGMVFSLSAAEWSITCLTMSIAADKRSSSAYCVGFLGLCNTMRYDELRDLFKRSRSVLFGHLIHDLTFTVLGWLHISWAIVIHDDVSLSKARLNYIDGMALASSGSWRWF